MGVEINEVNKAMTVAQLVELIDYIQKNHAWGHCRFGKGAWIKYIDPHYDFRGGEVFAIQFRGLHDASFYITNEFRDAAPLYDRIMEWLKSFEEK